MGRTAAMSVPRENIARGVRARSLVRITPTPQADLIPLYHVSAMQAIQGQMEAPVPFVSLERSRFQGLDLATIVPPGHITAR